MTSYPRSWKETSFDYKLLLAYHACMMILFIAGDLLSVTFELIITIGLAILFVSLSARHRRRIGWKWPGVSAKNVISGLVRMILGGLFLFAIIPLFPPSSSRILPWYLAGFGMVLFWLLRSFQVVDFAEADFLSKGGEKIKDRPPGLAQAKGEALWRRAVRIVYWALFLLVWLETVAFFYYSGVTYRDGSPAPTMTQTEVLSNHGQVMYVTPAEKALVHFLEKGMTMGIPSVMLLLVFVHFIVGVKLLANTPTLGELWERVRKKAD